MNVVVPLIVQVLAVAVEIEMDERKRNPDSTVRGTPSRPVRCEVD